MRTKTIALLLAAAMLAGSAGAVFAGEGPRPPRPDRDMNMPPPGPRGPGMRGPGPMRGPGMMGCPGMMRGGPGMMDDGPGMMGRFGPGMWRELNLDAAQKDALVNVMTENFRTGLKLRMEMADARMKLRDLRKDDQASGEDIIAANTEIGALTGKQEALRLKAREDYRAILNADQLKKLDDLRDRHPGPGRFPGGPKDRDGDRDGGRDGGHRDGRPQGPRSR